MAEKLQRLMIVINENRNWYMGNGENENDNLFAQTT